MRRRKLLTAGVLVVVVAIAGLIGWLAGTTSGLRFLAARALPLLPVTVESSAITGRLVGPLSIRRIEVQADGLAGTIGRVDLDWRPMALLRRKVHILHLDIEAPRLTVQPQEEADPGVDSEPFNLPWTIVVDRLSVQEGAVFIGEDLALEGLRLDAAGSARDDRLELSHLAFYSTEGEVAGHARASMRAPEDPWDIDLTWRVRLDEGVLAGHTRVTGKLADLAVEQTLAELVSARIEGRVSDLPETPAWSLGLSLEPLASRGPWPEALDGLAADLRVEGRLDDSRLTGRLDLPAVLPTRIDVDAEAGWEDGVARIRRLDLALGESARLMATGRLDAAEPSSAEFSVEGEALRWPLEGQPEIEVPRLSVRGSGAEDRWRLAVDARARRAGLPEMDLQAALLWDAALLTIERLDLKSPDGEVDVTITGVLDTGAEALRYHVVAAGDLRLPDQPSVTLRLSAEGDAEGVAVEALNAQLLGGTVEGHGRITWAGREAADFTLAFADLDPASLHPDFPGRLAGSLELRGAPGAADGLDIVLDSLRGELRSLPVRGRAEVNFSGERIELRTGSVAVGDNSLEGSGRVAADTLALSATLELTSLAQLDANARGSLLATARVSGPREEPRIILEANGADLGWQAWRAEKFHVDLDLDLTGDRASRALAEVAGAADGPGPESTLRVSGEGTPRDHRARLDLERIGAGQQKASAAFEGGLADGRWAGRLSALSLADEQQELWTLQRAAGLSIATDEVVLSDACMDGTFGLLCTEGRWNSGGAWGGRTALGELDLGPLSAWIGAGLLASGVLTGELTVAADEDGFQYLSGTLSLTAGELRFVEEEEGGVLVGWREGTMVFEGDHDEAQVALTLLLANTDRLEGRLGVGWNAEDPPLDGRLETELQQLQVITELLPDVADLEGRAHVQGAISGTVGAPLVTGRFEWLDGAAQVAALGIRPEGIHVVAELAEGVLEFRAEGRSGDGSFQADGRFHLGAETVEGVASLRGDTVLLANLPEARLTASPQLELTYAGRDIAIAGTVTIPTALISGLGGATAVTVSEDEVIVGAQERAEEEGVVVTSRVRVKVGPDVQIQAFGLRGRVEGNILTVTQPRTLPWGRGELRVVDGTFSAFGQRLEIETGRLIYTGGPLENPGLEIRAVRRVDEITAGALVRGTLQQPEISVFSDPPMARAEALSYLTLGKGLDELRAGERTTVNQAANSLALSGGGLIARDLGQRLGFDEVAVTADDASGGTSLVVGKYLGAGLYVSYGLGLFDTINTLRLRYQVNQRLSLEATSGDEVAADLYYTYERE